MAIPWTRGPCAVVRPTYHNAQRPIGKVDIMSGGRAARPIYISAAVVNLTRASTLADIALKGL
jgi:hypothetical protein